MTILAQRQVKGTAAKGSPAGPVWPQVNLLPPEIKAARGLKNVQRWLAIVIALVVVVLVLLYGLALMNRAAAAGELVDAQEQAQDLADEAAQYSEVTPVVNGITQTTAARQLGMSTEILWKGYLDAIAAVLPANVSITTFAVTQATPSIAAPAPADPLVEQGVATISFTSTATGLPDDAAWADALNSVPGFHGAIATTSTIGQLENGPTVYTVSSTVQVDTSAFAGRFAPAPAGGK